MLEVIFKRRKIVINPRLQYGVVSFFLGLSCLNVFFFVFAYWLSQEQIMSGFDGLGGPEQIYALDILRRQSAAFYRSAFYFSMFSLSVSFALGLILLNHIAGPAFAIKKYVDSLTQGIKPDRHPLKFRKHDFFYEVAESLSEYYQQKIAPKDSINEPK
jgi:hypothetical protein